MCLPLCRDPRPQRVGIAVEVWEELRRQKVPVEATRLWLHNWGVERFAELCWSHAGGVHEGLTKGILADEMCELVP